MTLQTNTDQAVDEAFWHLIWSDPDLLAADLHDLAEHSLGSPPPDRTPPDRTPPGGRPTPTPQPGDQAASDRPQRWNPDLATTGATAKVRSPPHAPERGPTIG